LAFQTSAGQPEHDVGRRRVDRRDLSDDQAVLGITLAPVPAAATTAAEVTAPPEVGSPIDDAG